MNDRRDRRAARIAWAASISLHGLLFAAIWFVPSRTPPKPTEPDGDLTFTLVEADDEPKREVSVPVTQPEPSPQTVPETPPTGRPPTAIPVPATLPASMAAFVRERADRPVIEEPVQDVVQVQQVAAAPTPAPVADVVRTADAQTAPATDPGPATTLSQPAASNPPATGGKPMHGPLPAGRTVVYVLDCSGTMGLGGKLARARACLLATLATQPPGVRVLVVTYSGRAVPLTDGPAEVTDAVRERIAAALAKLEPAGESHHAEGVRMALKFNPDYVLLLTDADDAELAAVKPILAGARRPVSASVAWVTGEGLESPRALPLGGPGRGIATDEHR